MANPQNIPAPPARAPRLALAKDGFFVAAIFASVLLAYQPVWHAGLIWDDDAHVTAPQLRSLHGLERIWTQVGATQQYYPLLHSAFWVEHRVFGDSPTGYHLLNIALHALAAILLWRVLRCLAAPAPGVLAPGVAYLAAAIFALHPVMVESVAWITEQKNTLSAVFYLGAVLAYLRFDRGRRIPWYALALFLFVLGLLSKTVTATLPGALLVVFWWQRGRLLWKKDVLPLLPFLVLGALGGLVTAYLERKLIGAEGVEFAFTGVERCLIAGRAFWFYLGKLLWPVDLIFIYPRWTVSQGVWWQYLYPLALLGLLGALWLVQRRWAGAIGRAPLAVVLLFLGTLFPVLGFFNVFPFEFSFVADHFQYLASMGVIVGLTAGAALLLKRLRWWGDAQGYVLGLMLLGAISVTTWRQVFTYTDAMTLYETTLRRNPDCWMAHNNLGIILARGGWLDKAIAHYAEALRVRPGYAEAHNNLGEALAAEGKAAESIAQFKQALRYRDAYAEAHNNLGIALHSLGQTDAAIAEHELALRYKPDLPELHNNLGTALAEAGRPHQAIAQYEQALRLRPDYFVAHCNLANSLLNVGRARDALAHCAEALRLKADSSVAHCFMGNALAALGRVSEAIPQLEEALRLNRDNAQACNILAWLLATQTREQGGDPPRAVVLAERACALTRNRVAETQGTLGAAYASAGRFHEAVAAAERAVALAQAAGQTALVREYEADALLYRAGQPCRTPIPPRP